MRRAYEKFRSPGRSFDTGCGILEITLPAAHATPDAILYWISRGVTVVITEDL